MASETLKGEIDNVMASIILILIWVSEDRPRISTIVQYVSFYVGLPFFQFSGSLKKTIAPPHLGTQVGQAW